MVALDHGGTDEPKCGKGRLVALHEVDRPFLAAIGGVETNEKVTHAPDIKVLSVVGWGGAYPTPVLPCEERNAHRTRPLRFPLLFAIYTVECPYDFVFTFAFDGKD